MKIPDFLEPFDSGNLVDFRIMDSASKEKEYYQIHDRVLHHVGSADTPEMAKFLTDSVNLAWKISRTQ